MSDLSKWTDAWMTVVRTHDGFQEIINELKAWSKSRNDPFTGARIKKLRQMIAKERVFIISGDESVPNLLPKERLLFVLDSLDTALASRKAISAFSVKTLYDARDEVYERFKDCVEPTSEKSVGALVELMTRFDLAED